MPLRRRYDNLPHAVEVLVRRLQKGVLTHGARPNGGCRNDDRGRVAEPKWTVRTSLTPARRAALVADYENGVGVLQLASAYGVHRDTVRRYLDASLVARRRRSLTRECQARAVEMYRSGETLAEVAEAIGTSKKTVLRVLDDLGIERRAAARRLKAGTPSGS